MQLLEVSFPTCQIGKNPKVWQCILPGRLRGNKHSLVADGNAYWCDPFAGEFDKSWQNCLFIQPVTQEPYCWESTPAGILKDGSTGFLSQLYLYQQKTGNKENVHQQGPGVISTVQDSAVMNKEDLDRLLWGDLDRWLWGRR